MESFLSKILVDQYNLDPSAPTAPTSATLSDSRQGIFPLLLLPGELRNDVYDIALGHRTVNLERISADPTSPRTTGLGIVPHKQPSICTALLAACKQVHQEATLSTYRTNTFRVTTNSFCRPWAPFVLRRGLEDLDMFASAIGPANARHLRTVTICAGLADELFHHYFQKPRFRACPSVHLQLEYDTCLGEKPFFDRLQSMESAGLGVRPGHRLLESFRSVELGYRCKGVVGPGLERHVDFERRAVAYLVHLGFVVKDTHEQVSHC